MGSARIDAQTLDVACRQFDTLRLRLIKIAARVVEMKTMIRVRSRFALGREQPRAFKPWPEAPALPGILRLPSQEEHLNLQVIVNDLDPKRRPWRR